MNKTLINSAILSILLVVIVISAYLFSSDKNKTDDKSEMIKTTDSTVLTDDDALKLVKQTWGDCTPDFCTKVYVTSQKLDDKQYLVTAIYRGLRDDSATAMKRVATSTLNGTNWVLGAPVVTHQCATGRGHQDFSNESCR
jgi:hypothetical protein